MGRMRGEAINVDGLTELQRALREMDGGLQRELTKTNKEVAGFVAADAKAAAFALGGVAAKAAPSIRPAAGAGWAGVRMGGAAYPFAGGAEFGALKYKQFQPWRGNGPDAGYFLYPAIRADIDRIHTEYTGALDDLLRRTGLK